MLKLNKQFLVFFYVLLFSLIYFFARPTDVYTVTAFCNCPICINKHEYLDHKFASNKETYFGGIAAPHNIPIGTKITLVPLKQKDQKAINELMDARLEYTVEDRGFLIQGKRLDIFVPKRLGGHATAQRWGNRKMRVLFNDSIGPAR